MINAGEWNWSSALAGAKDVVVATATAITAIVAIRGINRWRGEMTAKTEYDLARRVLHSAYRLRDAIAYVRNPGMSSSEYEARRRPEAENSHQQRSNDFRFAYMKRWEKIVVAGSQLDADLIEAEALWGSLLDNAKSKLREGINRLWISIQMMGDHLAQEVIVQSIFHFVAISGTGSCR